MRPVVLMVLVGLLAGCVTAPNADRPNDGPEASDPAAPECPGHWHFMLSVVLQDTTLPFDNESFLVPGPTELHWDTGSLVHIHPHISIPRCVPLEESLATLDLALSNDTLEVGPRHDAFSGAYTANDSARLVVMYEPLGASWQRVLPAALLPEQLPNGARLLISYGNTTAADLAEQLRQVPPIPDRYRPA